MDIGILVRGQSNAGYFLNYTAANEVRREVENDLGFDGVKDRIVVIGAVTKTSASGSPFLCPPAECPIGIDPWMRGAPGPTWTAGQQERIFLDYISKEFRAYSASTILTLWLHNESDEYDWRMSAAEWAGAVRADAALTRSTLKLDAVHSPYMFIWVPSSFGPQSAQAKSVVRSAQEIKAGMEILEQDASFHALAGPQTGDLDMSYDAPGFGYLHMTSEDALGLVHRVANCAANELRVYAHPGSTAADKRLDCHGPVAENATLDPLHPDRVNVALRLERDTAIRPLGLAAARGAGWVAVSPDGAETQIAGSASLVSTSEIKLTFPRPLSIGWRVHYGYGVGRISYDGGPGRGSALYDSLGIPMTMASKGLTLAAPQGSGMSGSGTTQNMTAGDR